MKQYAICARLGVGIMLLIFWGLFDSPLLGVGYMLALAALSAVRYRVFPYRLLMVLETLTCAGFAFFWLPALLGLWLPAVGLLEERWHRLEKELISKDYEDRAERLKLESMVAAQRLDYQNAARLAEMTERARIAQEIHDHVGHEISGASIALQAAIKLYEKNDARAGELLSQCARRLEDASARMRETVRNLKPSLTTGIETLEELCGSFDFCPVRFMFSGDMTGVTFWGLLAANLKEALTNAARHSNATMITVQLSGNMNFIRMTVTDNGKVKMVFTPGLGLSGMKERVRAAGGTFTVNTADGFQIVCVLPKVKEDIH